MVKMPKLFKPKKQKQQAPQQVQMPVMPMVHPYRSPVPVIVAFAPLPQHLPSSNPTPQVNINHTPLRPEQQAPTPPPVSSQVQPGVVTYTPEVQHGAASILNAMERAAQAAIANPMPAAAPEPVPEPEVSPLIGDSELMLTDSYVWNGNIHQLTPFLFTLERFCGQDDYSLWFVKTTGALKFENNHGRATLQPGELLWFVEGKPFSGDADAYRESQEAVAKALEDGDA